MPHLDGAHSHGSSRWDWRYVLVALAVGGCLLPAGRSFMFAGLTEALIWLGGGVLVASIVTVLMVWRSCRRGRLDYERRRADKLVWSGPRAMNTQFSTEFPETRRFRDRLEAENDLRRAMLSAQYGYPGQEAVHYDCPVHPELVQYGTITGRFRTGPEQAGHGHSGWPYQPYQETDWTAEVLSDTPGAPEALNPGHE